MLMLEQTQTILEIRAKVPLWNEVLMAVTKGPKKNTAVLLKLLRTGIEYQHIKFEIYGLAVSEEDHLLLDLLDRKAAGRILRGVAINSEEDLGVFNPNANKPPVSTGKDDSEAVMLHVADVTRSNAVLHRLQWTRVIDFLKHHRLGTGTDQRQEVDPKHVHVAGAYTGHMRHQFLDPHPGWTIQRICLGTHFKGEQSIAVEEGLNHVCCELDAVETQIGHEERVPQCHDTDLLPEKSKKAKQKQDQNLSLLALAAFRQLRLADEILQIDAWATPPFHSPMQATI